MAEKASAGVTKDLDLPRKGLKFGHICLYERGRDRGEGLGTRRQEGPQIEMGKVKDSKKEMTGPLAAACVLVIWSQP